MALSREELFDRIKKWRDKDAETSELAKQGILFDNLSDYLNDTFEGEQWDEEAQDYTPEYAKHEEDVLNDLGLSWQDVSALADYDVDNPVTSETIIDKDDDGDADVTITKQDDGDDNNGKKALDELLYSIVSADGSREAYDIANELPAESRNEIVKLWNSGKFDNIPNANSLTKLRSIVDSISGEADKPHDEGLAGDTTLEEDLMLNPDMSPSEFSKKAAEKRGAKPGEPAPDFNNFTNDIAKNLASRRW